MGTLQARRPRSVLSLEVEVAVLTFTVALAASTGKGRAVYEHLSVLRQSAVAFGYG